MTILKSSLTVLILLLCITSCDQELEDTSLTSLILGEWKNTDIIENTNFNQNLNYIFNSDNTFEVNRIVEYQATNALQGYRYKALGTYSLKENLLHLSKESVFEHDDSKGLFSDLEQLTLSDDQLEEVVTISFNSAKSEIIFIYAPCGELENCINSQKFQRK